ncbi:hypothetical protein NKR23_g10834 [Pleurostoma richardsiae]|uniref:DUF1857-domain-containing protein n=1 Tax=Pleurostoma richardsiae TaxID=41990 RepID=A0AA38R3W5_9PEZI|nr:hypothetical protein NKR23_g10834 [Pleurostoma richardsiae]
MVAANYVAFTAPINPPSASPQLTIENIWPLLQRKIRRAEDFVGAAIRSTDVISQSSTPAGQPVTVREVVFHEGDRRVREECVEFWPMKVEFHQPDGSKVQNIISEGAGGELYMTYTFEWLHPELEGNQSALVEKQAKEKAMAKTAVESTIVAMREMVKDGRWKETV